MEAGAGMTREALSRDTISPPMGLRPVPQEASPAAESLAGMSLEDRIERSIENVLGQLDEEVDAEDAVRWADAALKLTEALDTAFPVEDESRADAEARSPAD